MKGVDYLAESRVSSRTWRSLAATQFSIQQAMLSKVPGKDVVVHIIAARVRMDMKVCRLSKSGCGANNNGCRFFVNNTCR